MRGSFSEFVLTFIPATLFVLLIPSCATVQTERGDAYLQRIHALEVEIEETMRRCLESSDPEACHSLEALLLQRPMEYWAWGEDGDRKRAPTSVERDSIRRIVKREATDPILSMMICDEARAVVTTGVIRGPLDGGGVTFYLVRDGGEWNIVFRSGWVS